MATLREVRDVQPGWFSRENKRFFNDVSYRVLHGKVSGKPFLVRSTYGWSDMFGQKPRLHWRINQLEIDLSIGDMFDEEFRTIEDVKFFLKLQ